MTAALVRSMPFRRVVLVVHLYLFVAAILVLYNTQIADANAYLGYQRVDLDAKDLLLLTVPLLAAGMLLPIDIRRPSDFFFLFHTLFVVLPYAALASIRGPADDAQYLMDIAVLVFPLLVVRFATVPWIGLRIPSTISYGLLELILVLICLLGTAYALLHAPSSAGIDVATSYDRRIEGREVFHAGTLVAYVNAAITNGIAPFLAFAAAWRRRAALFTIALGSGLAFYYILGLKAPIFYIVLASVVGHAVRVGAIRVLAVVVFGLLWIAMVGAFVEFAATGYSFVADYFLRRTVAVPSFLLSAYFEFMFHDPFSGWSPLRGFHADEGITFFIGESYLGLQGANANTNAFVYRLAEGGLPAYLLATMLVAVVFAYLDVTFRSTRNRGLLFVGFLYALLLIEQAATTALVSSGIGVLILLISLARPGGRPRDALEVGRSKGQDLSPDRGAGGTPGHSLGGVQG